MITNFGQLRSQQLGYQGFFGLDIQARCETAVKLVEMEIWTRESKTNWHFCTVHVSIHVGLSQRGASWAEGDGNGARTSGAAYWDCDGTMLPDGWARVLHVTLGLSGLQVSIRYVSYIQEILETGGSINTLWHKRCRGKVDLRCSFIFMLLCSWTTMGSRMMSTARNYNSGMQLGCAVCWWWRLEMHARGQLDGVALRLCYSPICSTINA